MLLGTLIARLESEATAADLLQATGDVVLLARVDAASSKYGETHGAFASIAVSRFAQRASDEDWLALMNRIERTDDPAQACLVHMLEWALKTDAASENAAQACGCGSSAGAGSHHGHI